MPSRLRRLSGEEVVRILGRFGFQRIAQRGSHVKLRRTAPDGGKQTLHLPLHDELRMGTLRAIFSQACEYIDESQLRPHFYSET
jgi:predicted RNA binding protein YcfA (HicA-like mRNA interferase family)